MKPQDLPSSGRHRHGWSPSDQPAQPDQTCLIAQRAQAEHSNTSPASELGCALDESFADPFSRAGPCRIAAVSALSPFYFIEFLLRAFYNTAMSHISARLPQTGLQFPRTITTAESALIHVGVPCV